MAYDELEGRRWFRRRLQAIGKTYPELKDPEHQAACARWLAADDEESNDESIHAAQGQAQR